MALRVELEVEVEAEVEGGERGVAWRDLTWSCRWCGCDELKNDGGKGGVDVELVVV